MESGKENKRTQNVTGGRKLGVNDVWRTPDTLENDRRFRGSDGHQCHRDIRGRLPLLGSSAESSHSNLLETSCHNALNDFLRDHSCKREREKSGFASIKIVNCILFLCVHVCVYVGGDIQGCASVGVCPYAHAGAFCACANWKLTPGVVPQEPPILFLETGSLTDPGTS